MPLPLVSIIIPVYNAEKYLDECIGSALGQSWQNKQVIVVDDGSTDKSLEIAKKYESLGVLVSVQVNQGASAARNKGLSVAEGEYIQFLDADDILHAEKIEYQVNLLQKTHGSIALCPTVHFYDGEDFSEKEIQHEWYKSGSELPPDFLIKLYGGSLVGPGYGGAIQPNAWLAPRSVLDKAGYWNESLSLDDDGEFFCRAVLASKSIVYSAKSINYYRKFRSAKSLSSASSYKAFKSALHSNQLKQKHLLAATDDPLAKTALARIFMELAINAYPQFKDLSDIALQQADGLGGCFFDPYPNGAKNRVQKLAGWKSVKLLEYYKRKILNQ